jgi:hypothetical protein
MTCDCGRVRADPWPAPAFSLQVHFQPEDGVMPLGDLLDRQAGVHAVTEAQLAKDRANVERICSPVDGVQCPSPLAVLDTDGHWRAPASIRDVFLTLPEVLLLDFMILDEGQQVDDRGRRPHIVELPERMDLARLQLAAVLRECKDPVPYELQSVGMRSRPAHLLMPLTVVPLRLRCCAAAVYPRVGGAAAKSCCCKVLRLLPSCAVTCQLSLP